MSSAVGVAHGVLVAGAVAVGPPSAVTVTTGHRSPRTVSSAATTRRGRTRARRRTVSADGESAPQAANAQPHDQQAKTDTTHAGSFHRYRPITSPGPAPSARM